VLAGRGFTSADRLGTGALVLDQDLAAQLWGPGQGIGRMAKLGSASNSMFPWAPVVGIVPRVALAFQRDAEEPRGPVVFYVPPQSWRQWAEVVVRTQPGYVGRAEAGLRRELGEAVGGPGAYARPWTADMEKFLATRRFVALLFAVTGALGLLLTSAGLYAVVSRSVLDRQREWGLRLAFGATRQQLARQVVAESASIAAAGLAFGTPLALASGGLLSSLLYGVGSIDPPALIVAEFLIVAASAASAIVPAVKAAHTDPAALLRVV